MEKRQSDKFPFHSEHAAMVGAGADAVFDFLDDPKQLAAHMDRSSWMMAGSSMTVELDATGGRAVGAQIRLVGRVLGIPLSIDEAVSERMPPRRKVWQTTSAPRLLVIGPYRMGFEIAPESGACRLRVFIDYALPHPPWLGRLFGGVYARWCTRQIVDDALRHFGSGKGENAAERRAA